MAQVLKQSWLLSRRQMLRGSGVALSLPLLDCMRPLLGAEGSATIRDAAFLCICQMV